ncbi:MAG: TRAP transporter large permease subunit [Tissierellia bacterium]|nr:TRAP transporter large permease subunit [Tissierellia bacterium]
MLFNLSPIWALVPLIIYIILAFKDINPILNVVICVLLSAILTKQPLMDMGGVISEALGSFLAMIGFIIMLGSALGEILKRTGVAEYIVLSFMNKIGINNEKKAILAVMISSVILVALLGTLAGANAIIAPIVIPLVAAIGITPSTLAAVLHGAGATGLFIGPYSPQVVTIMGITGLSYGTYLTGIGLPVAIVCWLVTFFMSQRIQNKTRDVYRYENVEKPNEDYKVSSDTKRATVVFFISLIVLIIYGMFAQSGSSYAIVVMFTTAILTGIFGKLDLNTIFDTMIEGAGRMVWLFIMFVLFDPFIAFISEAGAFEALVGLIEPLLLSQSKIVFSLISTLTGIFGVGGAAVAQTVVMDNMFNILVKNLGISSTLWGMILLVGSQITSFAYPEADMLGQMGLARSKDLKNMVKFGITVTVATILLVFIRSFFG